MSDISFVFSAREGRLRSPMCWIGALRENSWMSALVKISSAKGCVGVSSEDQVRTQVLSPVKHLGLSLCPLLFQQMDLTWKKQAL